MMMMMTDGIHQEMMERNLRPRLCYLSKGERGYGFHLHGERSHGAQYIRKIEVGSPAELAGLRSGDRVVEVNGENVEKDSHHQVVQKIMEMENRTRLLVVDGETEAFLRLHSLPCTEEFAVEMSCFHKSHNSSSSLVPSPKASCTSSPRDSIPPSPRDSFTHSLQNSVSQSLCNSMTLSSCDSNSYLASESITSICKPPTPSPRNSNTSSPSDSVTPSQSNSVTLSPHGSITPSTSDSITPSPIASRNSSFHETTSFTWDKSNETNLMDRKATITNSEKETLRTEDMVMQDMRPRLCHMLKGKQGFGFNLHCDKRRVGQYIRSVDPDSPAERAGLLPGDRLIQVNDRNIEGLRHSEVVELIRGGGGEAKLLVVDPETDTLFNKLGIKPTTAHLNEDCVDGPLIDSLDSNPPLCSTTKPLNYDLIPSPIISTDPQIKNGCLKHQSHGSSSSHSTLSDVSMEVSNYNSKISQSDVSQCNSAPGGQLEAQHANDPVWDTGLRLSPTAAEARQKVRAKRAKKSAPPMAWSKKYEIFSNF